MTDFTFINSINIMNKNFASTAKIIINVINKQNNLKLIIGLLKPPNFKFK